ncbi:WD40-repeat-containing domain protein [Schizothecium vesticola]|uniref:WD40-repeat-containing domain protein n=1 Tax=Schizothecium vesticola TaxID=314040 RepID=A0AA40F1R5_9PEZI|nr:WD40-repeat-containing domain protein [Schizothecium vesticola]
MSSSSSTTSSSDSSGPALPLAFPPVPSEEGRKLMASGVFGVSNSLEPHSKRIAQRILDRELGLGSRKQRHVSRGLMMQDMIPSTKPEMIIHYRDSVCCGQFSDDGSFFFACVKDYKVRMYDTSNPYNWRYYKTVSYPFGRWTLTDADLSPDNKWLAYTSLTSIVCLAPTDPNDTGDPYSLDLGYRTATSRSDFPIYSARFSGDGRNIVAGTGLASIIVYDIERRTRLHHVRGHNADVNAVAFADKLSPHILYSGSDDCTIKVWDTRSLGDNRPAGAFVGHVEGLTYLDTKGDGRYVLSNAKDQTMKLWDLRMALTTQRLEDLDATRVTEERLDSYEYRWGDYDAKALWFPHPHDNSLVTFRGHRVRWTLIRCHFSPPGSTDSRYVYSGSFDGSVYVWNLDATLAAKIDVRGAAAAAAGGRRRRRGIRYRHHLGDEVETLVRDVGWHPSAPLLVASAWNEDEEGMFGGTATLHSYNEGDFDEAEPKMGRSVDEKLAPLAK